MKIQDVRLENLREYEKNPRNNENAVEAVAESIRLFGFKVPLVIDKGNVIIAGHTRAKAARLLGLEAVPCIIADDLTDEQIKAFRLADNKTAELAEWDMEKLEKELAEIEINMASFGFDENIFEEAFTTDFELPADDKPQTRTITLSLNEDQFIITSAVIDYVLENDMIAHDFGNNNKRSNALFEAVFEWAEQKQLN